MGHERLGRLPRTKHWRAVIREIPLAPESPRAVVALADNTLRGVRTRYADLSNDESIQGAFRLLVALPIAARSRTPKDVLAQISGFQLAGEPSPIVVARAFQASLGTFARTEKADLASKALGDTLGRFCGDPRFRQLGLFGSSPWSPWQEADSAAGFSELSRLFFSNLTRRYLLYFLDREAASSIPNPQAVATFRERLSHSVDGIASHAFETSKITQSFAAGWFQKNAKNGLPTTRQIKGFLSFALSKIREELRREADQG